MTENVEPSATERPEAMGKELPAAVLQEKVTQEAAAAALPEKSSEEQATVNNEAKKIQPEKSAVDAVSPMPHAASAASGEASHTPDGSPVPSAPPPDAGEAPPLAAPALSTQPDDAGEPTIPPAPITPSDDAAEPTALSDAAVLAHTAALWQYHPVPADEPDAAPEYKTEERKIGTADFIAARVRGKKHKHDGTNCDDWFAAAQAGDIAIVAVADGAGSKRFSRVGARAASEAAVGSIYEQLTRCEAADPEKRAALALPMADAAFVGACTRLGAILHEGVLAARRAVEAAFYERCGREAYTALLGRDLALADFAATLLVTIAVPVPELAERLFISCQVGDGMTCAIDTHAPYGKAVKLLGKPDSGDFSGETDFLTSAAMAELASLQNRTLVTRGAYDLLLTMTDGVADDYFNEKELHRLCLDLMANGIVPDAHAADTFTRADVELLRSLPKPQTFPWVNDKERLVALQYTESLCRARETTPEMLWQNARVLPLAAEDTSLKDIPSRAERLKIWLDNYMARGSFDDRTLALLSWGDDYDVQAR